MQRIVDEGHQLARHLLAHLVEQVARPAVDRVARDAAREGAEERARRVGVEHHGRLLRGDLLCAEERHRAPRGLAPDGLFVFELRQHATRRPVARRAVLAALVGGDGRHRHARVAAAVAAPKAPRGGHHEAARGAPEARALAVGDARVEVARGVLGSGARGRRPRRRPRRRTRGRRGRARGTVGELGRVGQAREGVFLREVAELEGVADEAREARGREVVGRAGGDAAGPSSRAPRSTACPPPRRARSLPCARARRGLDPRARRPWRRWRRPRARARARRRRGLLRACPGSSPFSPSARRCRPRSSPRS